MNSLEKNYLSFIWCYTLKINVKWNETFYVKKLNTRSAWINGYVPGFLRKRSLSFLILKRKKNWIFPAKTIAPIFENRSVRSRSSTTCRKSLVDFIYKDYCKPVIKRYCFSLVSKECEQVGWGTAQLKECLPGMHKVPGLIPSTEWTKHGCMYVKPSSGEVGQEELKFQIILYLNWRWAWATSNPF